MSRLRGQGPGGPGEGYNGVKIRDKKIIKRVLGLLKPYIGIVFIALVLSGVQIFASVYIPVLFAEVLNNYLGDFDKMIEYAMRILILAGAFGLSMYLKNILMGIVSQLSVKNLRKQAFDKLQTLPVSYFDQNKSGDVVSRLTNDIEMLSSALGETIIQFITSVVQVVTTFIMLYLFASWQLAIVVTIAIPIIFFILSKLMKKMFKYFQQQSKHIGEVNSIVEESVQGLTAVKLFNQEQEIIEEFKIKNEELKKVSYKASILANMFGPLITVINNIVYVLIISLGAFLNINYGTVNVGQISIATAYAGNIMNPIRQLGQLINNMSSGIAGAQRVFALIDVESEYVNDGEFEFDKIEGHVEFKNVVFSYVEGKVVINNISFSAEKGETVAIVGATGSGKTTIINLLSKFYDIDSGEINIDGININTVKKKNLRKRVGVVLQDSYLFSGNVLENIRYGNIEASDEEVIAAAKQANADGFISRLPKGYDTLVQNGGKNFSQGERQLISIARTILSDPHILILDEATSNVDTRTESIIQDSMHKMMDSRTSFVIAHRLQTISKADKILVLDQGEIIEKGSHQELLDLKGKYHMLYTTQFRDS